MRSCQERERPLCRSEIVEIQRRVRAYDADQRHVREIVPLRDHLRADKNIRLMISEPREYRLMRELPPGRVRVEPQNPRLWIQVGKLTRDQLRPEPAPPKMLLHGMAAEAGLLPDRGGAAVARAEILIRS